MSLSGGCLRGCGFFGGFPDSFGYSSHLKGSTAMAEALRALKNAGKSGNGSVYEKLQLMANLAVIGVLFKRFYGYLLILGIFPLLGVRYASKNWRFPKREHIFAIDDNHHANVFLKSICQTGKAWSSTR